MKKLLVIPLLLLTLFAMAQSGQSIKDFGAKGDGVADDTQALIKGIQTAQTLLIPAGTYNIKGVVNLIGLHNKVIIADKGAIIRNIVDDKGSFNIYQCENFAIHGGTWTYLHLPAHNSADGQACVFIVSTCKNFEATDLHIIGSAEMGFDLVADIGVNISNNIIEQCYRDGIYSHYSSNLLYCGNYIHDIKDDAMSIHDYGIAAQKTFLSAAGIMQAGNSVVFNNTTKNTYQGFGSIGCTKLFIADNNMQNTVNGGITIFNAENLFVGTTARANRIVISNNFLSHIGGKPKIMNDYYGNGAQIGTGRAAIFVGVLDEKSVILTPKSRIQYITINNNTINDNYEEGIFAAQVDHLNIFSNRLRNNNASGKTHSAVEIKNCSAVFADKNTIVDTRQSPAAEDFAYSLDQVSGTAGDWGITGQVKPSVTGSSMQTGSERSKDVALNLKGFTLPAMECKIIRQHFSPGLLADYINLSAPAELRNRVTCNACLDPESGTLIVVVRNISHQALNIPTADWGVREFYH